MSPCSRHTNFTNGFCSQKVSFVSSAGPNKMKCWMTQGFSDPYRKPLNGLNSICRDYLSTVIPWWLRGQRVPAMRETWDQSLGREDPQEKEMPTHSSILAWRIPWMEEPGGLQSMGLQRVGYDWGGWTLTGYSQHLTWCGCCVNNCCHMENSSLVSGAFWNPFSE